jgi:hypothetical protein
MKRNFAVLTISGRLLKPLLMLPYLHPAINKQAVFIKLSKARVVARSVQHPKILRFRENFDSQAIRALPESTPPCVCLLEWRTNMLRLHDAFCFPGRYTIRKKCAGYYAVNIQ